MGFRSDFESARGHLDALIESPQFFLDAQQIADDCISSIQNGGKLMLAGNGGSLADASHFAEELTGKLKDPRPAIPAIAFADGMHMTCTANDFGFEFVFSRMVEALGRDGDVLILLTTSGNSQNLLKAAEAASKIGVKVIGLTGRGGGRLKPLCTRTIDFPGEGSDRIQELQMLFLHSLAAEIEAGLGYR